VFRSCFVFQPTDSVHMCVFDLVDGSRWKAMSDDAVRSMCDSAANPDWPSLPPLSASPLDAALVSNELEHELRSLVTQHRKVSCVLDQICTSVNSHTHIPTFTHLVVLILYAGSPSCVCQPLDRIIIC